MSAEDEAMVIALRQVKGFGVYTWREREAGLQQMARMVCVLLRRLGYPETAYLYQRSVCGPEVE